MLLVELEIEVGLTLLLSVPSADVQPIGVYNFRFATQILCHNIVVNSLRGSGSMCNGISWNSPLVCSDIHAIKTSKSVSAESCSVVREVGRFLAEFSDMVESKVMVVDLSTGVLPGFNVLKAAREGDVDGVLRYLDGGGNVHFCSTSTERTLLHIACRQVSWIIIPTITARADMQTTYVCKRL